MNETIRKMMDEVNAHAKALSCLGEVNREEATDFKVTDTNLWRKTTRVEELQRRMGYYGVAFTYENGHVTFVPMEEETFYDKQEVKDKAWRRYYLENNVTVSNQKMDAYLAQLPDMKQIHVQFPYETKTSNTIVWLFPKDTPSQNHADIEECDALIVDFDYNEYIILKTMENGFTEVFSHGVHTRAGMADGGMFYRLRETAFIDHKNGFIYVIEEDAMPEESNEKFSEEELAQALMDCYGKTFQAIGN